MRCGGIFNKYSAANVLENLTVKNFENRSRINTDTAVSLVSLFLEPGVYTPLGALYLFLLTAVTGYIHCQLLRRSKQVNRDCQDRDGGWPTRGYGPGFLLDRSLDDLVDCREARPPVPAGVRRPVAPVFPSGELSIPARRHNRVSLYVATGTLVAR